MQKRDGLYEPAPVAGGPPEGDEGDPDTGYESRSGSVGAALHGQRLDKVLAAMAPEFSRNHLQGLIEAGHVEIDGVESRLPARKLRAGQALRFTLVPPAETLAYRPEPMSLSVVYEDEHVLVIDKPAGLVVHPAAGNWTGTLLNGLLARDPAAAALPRAGIVHRLDKDTSGLMVVGRSLQAVTQLVRDLASRVVSRQYLALVHGNTGNAPFQIDAPIGRDPSARIRMAVVGSGKPARTDVTPVAFADGARFPKGADGYSAIRCALHTGRTHQIRVHLASRRHPLVSDTVYGGSLALGMARQALHAAALAFEHPVTHEAMRFTAVLPGDLATAWQAVAGADPLL